jgi:hypothetical protein
VAAWFRMQALMIMVIAAGYSANGQAIDEYQMKAAFIYNFAKFVEWPPNAFRSTTEPLAICILGEDPFGHSLDETVQAKSIEGRAFLVRRISGPDQATGCQIVFVSNSERRQFSSIITRVSTSGVLTVGESEGFAAQGGVINFKLENERRIRLEINLSAARGANLRISSKLLSLALIVRK